MLYAHWGWWLLGFVVVLGLLGDDDDRHCYDFGSERLCFDEPLPRNADCFLTGNRQVQCFAKGQN